MSVETILTIFAYAYFIVLTVFFLAVIWAHWYLKRHGLK